MLHCNDDLFKIMLAFLLGPYITTFIGNPLENGNMSKTVRFEYDLGKGWKLAQYANDGKEAMIFYQDNELEGISLPNESCERLRAIFKHINK